MTKTLEQLMAKVKEIKDTRWGGIGNTGMYFFTKDRHDKLNILATLILQETGATDVLTDYSSTYDILKWYYEDKT